MEIINGAVGATISTYLETCFLEHVDDDVDLVVIELAINDQRLEMLAESYENLMRAVFDLPSHPAIVHLQVSSFFLLLFLYVNLIDTDDRLRHLCSIELRWEVTYISP